MVELALALLLSGQPDTRQVAVPAEAEWVGPLEFTDHRGTLIVPTRVKLTLRDGRISGDWFATTSQSTGHIEGTVDPTGKVTALVTLYGGAEVDSTVIATERCSSEVKFTGSLTRTGVFRLTAGKAIMTTPQKEARGRHCEDLTKLVWTLQRH